MMFSKNCSGVYSTTRAALGPVNQVCLLLQIVKKIVHVRNSGQETVVYIVIIDHKIYPNCQSENKISNNTQS